MKIVIDENMPYAKALFSRFGEVIILQGRQITANDLVDVDALICRSVTKVDLQLLSKANKLSFVGTATAGTDHIDKKLLNEKGICFRSASGCNKIAVAEYVLSALLNLAWQNDFNIKDRQFGIVGAGEVGSYLANCLDALSIPYMLCDPPKQKQGDPRQFVKLTQIIKHCDVISLHTPITKNGKDPTYHLIGKEQLEKMLPDTILINAARGAVVDNQALKEKLQNSNFTAVLDVFEHEPLIDLELLDLLAFATPHIAGYSVEGKARGTVMIFNAFCDFLNKEHLHVDLKDILTPAPISRMELNSSLSNDLIMSLCQMVYDIRNDDHRFRKAMSISDAQRYNFDQLRKNYWNRREYSSITLGGKIEYGVESLAKLGFNVEVIT